MENFLTVVTNPMNVESGVAVESEGSEVETRRHAGLRFALREAKAASVA
jgi:hypothetical protein